MLASLQTFGPAEFGQLDKAMALSEEAVSDFFRLNEGFWSRHPFELATAAQLAPRELSHECLAQVLRLRRPPVGGWLRARDFYRICLQDHNLLSVVGREGQGELFAPLLVYVLTHELVHVVRFSKFLHLFDAPPSQRLQEEAKVHRIAANVLAKVRLPRLERVLGLYESHCADVADFAAQ